MEEYPIIKKKLVIVEDNPALSEIYKVRLELIGYEVFIAMDGEIALQVIERELPDLVLLDLMIPKVSGGDVLARMRASEWGKKIRVYVISNLNEREAPANLRSLGIEGYAVKANLTDNDIDKLVDNILTPQEQKAAGDTNLTYSQVTTTPEVPQAPKNVYGVHMIKISKKAAIVFTGMIVTLIGYSALMIVLFGATESHTQVLAFIAGLFLIVFVFLMMLRKKERRLSDYNDVVQPPPESIQGVANQPSTAPVTNAIVEPPPVSNQEVAVQPASTLTPNMVAQPTPPNINNPVQSIPNPNNIEVAQNPYNPTPNVVSQPPINPNPIEVVQPPSDQNS